MKNALLVLSFAVCCIYSKANESPVVNAGSFQSIYLPVNSVQLNGSATDVDGNIASYIWTKIAGPGAYTIVNPTNASTAINNLVAGEYNFELTVTDAQGASGKDTVQIVVYKTANMQVPAVGNYPSLMGANPGYYGSSWSDVQVYSLMANAGCKSTRSTVPMFFFGAYGDSIRYAEFNYFHNTLGFRENVFFLYNEASAPFPDRSTEYFNGEQAAIPGGLYLPVWNADGSVNMNNSFARYCYKVVKVYGAFSKYYEIWNEPDFTSNWGVASALPGVAGNWWENDPNTTDLLNIKAPIQYYIRMLRVAYEVIKRYQPEAIITLGGLGYPSFMHALLRNTDNPVADGNGKLGSVTNEYPLKAGAYFDGLSFHSYPQYFLKFWDYTTATMAYKRHSDEAIDQTIRDKQSYQKILQSFGYGTTYPDKPVICTEINIPRKALNGEIGGIEVQRNFAWKAVAKAARNNISQMYWFVTGEVIDYNSASQYDAFKVMGLYENLLRDMPGSEKLTDEGRANKSAQLLLENFLYDATTTNNMNLPGGVDGAAFTHPNTGETRFMLWAKTHTDNLENSQMYYSFPSSVVNNQLDVYKWNYCVTNTKTATVQPTGILLTAEPVILIKTNLAADNGIPVNAQLPAVNAGGDTTINIPYIVLNGTATHPGNLSMNYFWDMISMSGSEAEHPSFKNSNTSAVTVVGLKKGLYAFRFTASDQRGLFATDTVWVAVDTVVSFFLLSANKLPVARAGRDTTIYYPSNNFTLSAAGSYDPDGTIISHKWKLLSGPSAVEIITPTAASSTVKNLHAGVYVFQLSVTDNRGGISMTKLRVNVSNHSLVLVPGKAAIYIYIDDDLASPFHVQIFDASGRLMQQHKLVNRSLTSPLSFGTQALRSGLYFISLTDATGKKLSQKFIRE